MEVLGIDIGGSGIKGALVDTVSGNLLSERKRIPTPQPATTEAVSEVIRELARAFHWKGPIGCGFPSVILHGVAKTAANVDKSWIEANVRSNFESATNNVVRIINDADAAGLAEAGFGAGKDEDGLILVITVGTGIGSALIYRGLLVPNSELGHLPFKGGIVEHYAADSARKREDLKWKEWAGRFNEVLNYYYKLFYPDLFVIGGGVSKKFHKFEGLLDVPVEVKPAMLLNEAGIIGAAMAAEQKLELEGHAGSWIHKE